MTRHRYDPAKRAIDLVLGVAALILSLPVQLVLACLVRAKLGAPVLFRQTRPGKDGQVFELIKFRTMLEIDPQRELVTDQSRLTSFGSVLRSTSLDELPSLWNVIKGDMSIVGPRPLLVQYLERYTPAQMRRHEVRPGMTGLAQVSGRNALTWAEKFERDIEYVDSRNFRMDVRIIARTVMQVLRRHGISADGDVTMPEFRGSPHEKTGHDPSTAGASRLGVTRKTERSREDLSHPIELSEIPRESD